RRDTRADRRRPRRRPPEHPRRSARLGPAAVRARRQRKYPMIVEAIAPSRIDLAGGTLDIYPLYLFEEGGITVNIGTDVGSRARALNALNRSGHDPEAIITFGADLEAQNIRIPTGKQDYYAAMYGGVNAIWFNVGGNRVERLLVDEVALHTLETRLILSFTGI